MTALSEIEALALAVVRRLQTCDVPCAVGGALAYNYYGIPRATGDIDVNVFVPMDAGDRVLQCLVPLGVDQFDSALRRAIATEGQCRILVQGRWLDLFFAVHALHDACRDRLRLVQMGDGSVPILSPEDLVVFKVLFNRPKDWVDVERLAHAVPSLDRAYVLRWIDEILGPGDSATERLRELLAPRP